MLVLIGPPFSGSEDEYGRIAQVAGLLPYELKTKLKPGAWGVIKAIAAPEQAEALGRQLRDQGFRVAVVDTAVAADPGRMFVPLRALELGENSLVLHLSERSMPIPYRALLTIVRGEVQLGSRQRSRPASSSTFRAVVPEAGVELVAATQLDAFAAADLHFATVLWAARIDARAFDFSILGQASGGAQDLDRLGTTSPSVSACAWTGRVGCRAWRRSPAQPARRGPPRPCPARRRSREKRCPSASTRTRGWWPRPSATLSGTRGPPRGRRRRCRAIRSFWPELGGGERC